MGKKEGKVEINDVNNISIMSEDSSSREEEMELEGLCTGLSRKESTKQAPSGSANLEKIFHCLESTLLEKARQYKAPNFCSKDKAFLKLHNQLQKEKKLVVLPIYKTNSYCTVEVEKFTKWVIGHLDKNAECMPRKKVVEIQQEATKFAGKLAGRLSRGENGLLQESLEARAILQPQLLVKDHKDKDKQ
eukprot:14322586-Ditylum_brightwellii.AAC.1